MVIGIVSIAFVVVICILAYRANARFRDEARLPMQWGMTENVNWSAPRPVVLAFMPVLAAALLGFITVMAMTVPPRPGQEHLLLPASLVMGAALVVAQLFHFWLIDRTLRSTIDWRRAGVASLCLVSRSFLGRLRPSHPPFVLGEAARAAFTIIKSACFTDDYDVGF